MEDLNKNQIVLLTVLISFITSIATGIMTASMLQEAPIEVTRNINRIVEKTIETVTPQTILTPGQKEVTTVVVKEEDLIVDSINKNLKSIVRIEEKDTFLGNTSFYGMGLVVTKEGLILSDRKTINSANIYTATFSDDSKHTLSAVGVDKQTNFLLFKVEFKEDEKPVQFSPVKFSDTEVKLGQTVISIGGDVSNVVVMGRVVSLLSRDNTVGTTTTKTVTGIETDLTTKDLLNGSPLFNLSGDVVGLKPSISTSKTFIPSSILKSEVSNLSASKNQ